MTKSFCFIQHSILCVIFKLHAHTYIQTYDVKVQVECEYQPLAETLF